MESQPGTGISFIDVSDERRGTTARCFKTEVYWMKQKPQMGQTGDNCWVPAR